MKKLGRIGKKIIIIIIFITLPSILFYGFIYLKYHEDLPEGIEGVKADIIATKMLESLNANAFFKSSYLEFTVMNKRHYEWERDKNICTIYWQDFKVEYDLKDPLLSNTYIHSFKVTGEQQTKLITKAKQYFQKDTFWVIAPYTIFDANAVRKMVQLENGSEGLLVTYTKDGISTTKDESFLWYLDANNKPIKTKIWSNSFPFNGLEATWDSWSTTQSGAQLPNFHKIVLFGITINNITSSK